MLSDLFCRLRSLARMSPWLLAGLAASALIAVLAPQQIGVTLYKLSLVLLAAWLGYWIDRGLFPYARPHQMHSRSQTEPARFSFATLRRAVIVAAVVIAVGLGA
mgnify:CR=1 FL=1